MIPTLPPSSSSAFGVNSLPTASSSKLPVHRSPGGNRFDSNETFLAVAPHSNPKSDLVSGISVHGFC